MFTGLAEVFTVIEEGIRHGLWGGLTERQRRALRRAAPGLKVESIRHGTPGGYMAHRRRGSVPCPSCLEARAVYAAERRLRIAGEAS